MTPEQMTERSSIAVAGSFGYSGAFSISGAVMPKEYVTFRGCKYGLGLPGPYYRSHARGANGGPSSSTPCGVGVLSRPDT